MPALSSIQQNPRRSSSQIFHYWNWNRESEAHGAGAISKSKTAVDPQLGIVFPPVCHQPLAPLVESRSIVTSIRRRKVQYWIVWSGLAPSTLEV